MDRNDSNPGMVERQLDETPMQGRPVEREEMERGSSPDRDSLQRGGSVEREGMQGEAAERDDMRDAGSVEREGMEGAAIEREDMRGRPAESDLRTPSDRLGAANTSANDTQMRLSGREGGYGFDRPADVEVTRDTMQSSSRGTDQGTDHGSSQDRSSSGDLPRDARPARDW